jgi:hypothetical protein
MNAIITHARFQPAALQDGGSGRQRHHGGVLDDGLPSPSLLGGSAGTATCVYPEPVIMLMSDHHPGLGPGLRLRIGTAFAALLRALKTEQATGRAIGVDFPIFLVRSN